LRVYTRDGTPPLDELIGALMQSRRNLKWLKGGIGGACKVLAKAVAAAVLAEAVRVAVNETSPHAAELVRNLLDHGAHLLPSMSMVLLAGVVEDATDIERASDQRAGDIPEKYKGLPGRRTRLPRRRVPIDSQPDVDPSSMSMFGPQDATEPTRKDLAGPDDIAHGMRPG
jgi:hypothetical protein